MEIYCLYGIGILTERSHIHKFSTSEKDKSIPFQIDSSVDREEEGSWLQNGVYYVDGDESVPIVSSGFMLITGGVEMLGNWFWFRLPSDCFGSKL